MKNAIQKRVMKAKVEGIENAYIFTSGQTNTETRAMELVVTLAYVNEATGVAADWEPRHGPISIWHRCEADAEGARPHYIFDYVNDGFGNWSQLAVEQLGLRDAFLHGDFAYIFAELRGWVELD
jgi:hypothetical protein